MALDRSMILLLLVAFIGGVVTALWLFRLTLERKLILDELLGQPSSPSCLPLVSLAALMLVLILLLLRYGSQLGWR